MKNIKKEKKKSRILHHRFHILHILLQVFVFLIVAAGKIKSKKKIYRNEWFTVSILSGSGAITPISCDSTGVVGESWFLEIWE